MDTGNMGSIENADDFIPVEKDEETEAGEVRHIDGGEKSYSFFHKPGEEQAVPTHVSEGMQQMQKEAQQLQQEQQPVQYIDGGEKPYSFFHKPGEAHTVPTHISEGMEQMQRDSQQLQQEQQSVPVHLSENVQEVKVETEESDYKKVNSEIIEILKNEPKFEGAFQDVTFSNGEKALIYNRGMFAFSKNELPSNLGISDKYSTPKNISEVIQEKNSAIMLTNEGMIFLVTGGVYNRNAQEYEAIYKKVMSKRDSNGNPKEFQTTFSNTEIFPDQGFSDSGVVTDGKGNIEYRDVDVNFYLAMYMKDCLNAQYEGLDVQSLLKEFAEASVLAKEEKERNRRTSPEELKAMITGIN